MKLLYIYKRIIKKLKKRFIRVIKRSDIIDFITANYNVKKEHAASTGSVYYTISYKSLSIFKIRVSDHLGINVSPSLTVVSLKNSNDFIIIRKNSRNPEYIKNSKILQFVKDEIDSAINEQINCESSLNHIFDNSMVFPKIFESFENVKYRTNNIKKFTYLLLNEYFGNIPLNGIGQYCDIFNKFIRRDIPIYIIYNLIKATYTDNILSKDIKVVHQDSHNYLMSLNAYTDRFEKTKYGKQLSKFEKLINEYKFYNGSKNRNANIKTFMSDCIANVFPWYNSLDGTNKRCLQEGIVFAKGLSLITLYTYINDEYIRGNDLSTIGVRLKGYLKASSLTTLPENYVQLNNIINFKYINELQLDWLNYSSNRTDKLTEVYTHLCSDVRYFNPDKLTDKQLEIINNIIELDISYKNLIDILNSTFGMTGTTNSLKTAYNQCKHITPYSEIA